MIHVHLVLGRGAEHVLSVRRDTDAMDTIGAVDSGDQRRARVR